MHLSHKKLFILSGLFRKELQSGLNMREGALPQKEEVQEQSQQDK